MENTPKAEAAITQKLVNLEKEAAPALYGLNEKDKYVYTATENELNAKILEITSKIEAHHPELIKYLEEMPVTIPNEKYPSITVENLEKYYASLLALVRTYEEGHRER